MTPDDRLYRDMWLAECWNLCPEYKPTQRATARPKAVEKPRDKRLKKAS